MLIDISTIEFRRKYTKGIPRDLSGMGAYARCDARRIYRRLRETMSAKEARNIVFDLVIAGYYAGQRDGITFGRRAAMGALSS